MSFVSRGARAAARPLKSSIRQPPRRFAGHEAGHGHGEAHHSGESALHVAGGSGNEGFGRGLYFALATIPLFYVVYSVASSPGDNFISRLVLQYDAGREAVTRRDALHTTMMEQAAADRQLFASAETNASTPSLRMQEMFNFGSPWNVSAGHGADLSALIKHYENENKEIEQQRVERFKKLKDS